MLQQKSFDGKFFSQCLFVILGVFLLMTLTDGVGFVVVVPLALHALAAKKNEWMLLWLLFAICSLIVNPRIVGKGLVFAYSQKGLMVVIGSMMVIRELQMPTHRSIKPFGAIIAYILFMCISSAYGWSPIVSYLKLFLFTVIYFALFGMANIVGCAGNISTRKIRSILLAYSCIFIFGSVLVVPFPELSQMSPDQIIDNPFGTSLFMGMTNHSQCLGPVVASLATILLADMLFAVKKMDPIYVALLICCPYLIYKTSSRTGMASYIISQMFVVYLIMRSHNIGSKWKAKINGMVFAVVVLGSVCFAIFGSVTTIQRFITKKSKEQNVTIENVMSSRQALIDNALGNFHAHPYIGNGFQVSPYMKYIKRDSLSDVLSAPVEKGVWITAVLEEGGIIGWILFVVFLLSSFISCMKRKAYIGASMLLLAMLVNMGEFTFFSMSYTGGFVWAMVFVGLAFDIKRTNDEAETRRLKMLMSMRTQPSQ